MVHKSQLIERLTLNPLPCLVRLPRHSCSIFQAPEISAGDFTCRKAVFLPALVRKFSSTVRSYVCAKVTNCRYAVILNLNSECCKQICNVQMKLACIGIVVAMAEEQYMRTHVGS